MNGFLLESGVGSVRLCLYLYIMDLKHCSHTNVSQNCSGMSKELGCLLGICAPKHNLDVSIDDFCAMLVLFTKEPYGRLQAATCAFTF